MSGFALIVALALMTFILLLLISLSTMLRVEISSSTQKEHISGARHNAMLALTTAIGQLQKNAGPDQRVTAPANIDLNAAEGKAHWTGVWVAGREGGVDETDFLGWLTSLPGGTANVLGERDIANVDWTPNNDDWVQLVGAGTVTGGALTDYVAAGKVSVGDTGAYAYWVGEENTKARINLEVPAVVSTTDADLRAPRYTGFNTVDTDLATISPSDERLSHITSLEWLGQLANSNNLDERYFHDLSVFGQGVQVDVVNGGLKQDLTHLLENNAAFTRHFGVSLTGSPTDNNWPEPYTFRAANNTYDFPNGAPNWGILGSYYRLYNTVNNGTLAPIVPLPAGTGNKSAGVSTYHSDKDVYQYNQPVHPVTSLIRLGLGLSFNSVADSTTMETTYRPTLHIKPLIALYNPYDVAISASGYNYNWEFKPTIAIKVGPNQTVTFNMQEVLPEEDEYGATFRWRIESDTDLQPGETRYYALNQPYSYSDKTGFGDYAHMEAEWTEDGAYTIDLTQASYIVEALAVDNTASPYSHLSSTSNNKSSAFGLTQSERDALTLVLDSTDSPANYNVSVSVDYGALPWKAGRNYRATNGDFYMRIGDASSNDSGQIAGSYYQEYESTMAPFGVTGWSPTLASLVGQTLNITAVEFKLRAADDTAEPHRMLIDANPRPIILSGKQEGFRSGNGLSTYSGWAIREYTGAESQEPNIASFDRYSSHWGNTRESGVGTAPGADRVVLFHIPREPLISLGAFQHANLGRFNYQPAYIFANSYATSKIPADQTDHTYAESSSRDHYAYDWSYAINNAVWDSYFLSTIPQSSNEAENLFDDILAQRDVLPNPRFSLYLPQMYNLSTQELADLLTDDNAANTSGIAAGFLLTEGVFNVNSTSVQAWKAFLASNTGLTVPTYEPTTGMQSGSENVAETVFYRSPIPYDSGFSGDEQGLNFWKAHRKLDDAELTALATAMVDEVRARGPFASLGDFVNRRPDATDASHRLSGPLQAALDSTVNAGLSENLIGSTRGNALRIPNFQSGVNGAGDAPAMGMPGWVLQGDVLQSLGPLMTVRSDTFRIRAYGEQIDPLTDKVVAQAWCEAIVQRVPDPVLSNAALTLDELHMPPNALGREFRVVDFRWLSKDEI